MCLFLGSVGAIILILTHTFLINPLRALAVVFFRIPGNIVQEYNQGLLVSSGSDNDPEPSLTGTANSRRPGFISDNPLDEELIHFLNFHSRHEVRVLRRANNSSSSPSANSNASSVDQRARQRRTAGLDSTRPPPVDLGARLPVVLNYRRREQPSEPNEQGNTANDQIGDQIGDQVDDQVDDPLTYFFRTTVARNPAQNMTTNSSGSSKLRKIYSDDEWEKVVNDMNVSFHDLNSLIMNYLVVEGYQDAAQKFAREAKVNLESSGLQNISLPYSSDGASDQAVFNSVHDRMVIRHLIHTGQIQPAIEKINDVDPELLDTHGDLHFALLRLQLIELIRACNYPSTLPKNHPLIAVAAPGCIDPALEFATTHLARRAPANPKFLADLELTMALLCFPPDDKALVPELRNLMDVKLRQSVAREVNTTILARQGVAGEAKITNLVKLLAWGEQELAKESVVFPHLDRSTLG